MLTKKGLDNILKRVMACGELTEELENDIALVQADYDESRGILQKVGTVNESEELESYDFVENELIPQDNGFEQKYNEMRQKYIDRFFGGNADETKEDLEEPPKEPIKEVDENQTIDSLFKKEE